jgi:hypothetical protein
VYTPVHWVLCLLEQEFPLAILAAGRHRALESATATRWPPRRCLTCQRAVEFLGIGANPQPRHLTVGFAHRAPKKGEGVALVEMDCYAVLVPGCQARRPAGERGRARSHSGRAQGRQHRPGGMELVSARYAPSSASGWWAERCSYVQATLASAGHQWGVSMEARREMVDAAMA